MHLCTCALILVYFGTCALTHLRTCLLTHLQTCVLTQVLAHLYALAHLHTFHLRNSTLACLHRYLRTCILAQHTYALVHVLGHVVAHLSTCACTCSLAHVLAHYVLTHLCMYLHPLKLAHWTFVLLNRQIFVCQIDVHPVCPVNTLN